MKMPAVLLTALLAAGRLGTFVTEKIQEPARLSNGRKLTCARGLSLTLRFNRDNAGKVVALDLTSPVFRKVRFTRR